jgi:hypothetical protein
MGTRPTSQICLAIFGLFFICSCGEDAHPGSGYSSPCDTPAFGAMGCPARPPSTSNSVTIYDACNKLVSCGVLANEWFGYSSGDCSTAASCANTSTARATGGPGRCIKSGNNQRCYYHAMDYAWCVARFSTPGSHPCAGKPFVSDDIKSILSCIASTPCSTVGLALDDRYSRSTSRPHLRPRKERESDKITCNNNHIYWTATTCDQGLLRYEEQQP